MFLKTPRKESDEELMRLIASGNSHAFTELYRRYSKLLLRYFFRMLWNNEAQAQDFLHDLFLKIIERPEYFDPSRKFSTWVYSVANNMCKNEYRKEAFRNGVREMERSEAIRMLVASEKEDDDMKRSLDKAILKLDEDDKHLYTLRFELEMPLEEIASMLQCPTGTVKSKLFYLKKKLAVELVKEFPERKMYGA